MLRLKLLNRGIPCCLVDWIFAFLSDRAACSKVNSTRSEFRAFRAGLPQGSVLSPTLYVLWAADLVEDLRDLGTQVFMYADDTATLSAGSSIDAAVGRAQRAADVITRWACKWKMAVAGEKTQALVLSQWANDAKTANNTALYVGGKRVRFGSSLKLFSVHFDRLLHFGGHYKALRQRVRLRLEQLWKITGRSWGLDETHIRSVAAGYVRGALEHAVGAWLPLAAKSHRDVLQVLTNAVSRVVSGCTASTPIDALLAEAGMVSVYVRQRALAFWML
jgi:hypothetical protein